MCCVMCAARDSPSNARLATPCNAKKSQMWFKRRACSCQRRRLARHDRRVLLLCAPALEAAIASLDTIFRCSWQPVAERAATSTPTCDAPLAEERRAVPHRGDAAPQRGRPPCAPRPPATPTPTRQVPLAQLGFSHGAYEANRMVVRTCTRATVRQVGQPLRRPELRCASWLVHQVLHALGSSPGSMRGNALQEIPHGPAQHEPSSAPAVCSAAGVQCACMRGVSS